MPAHRRYEVLAWRTKKMGRYIIEDDYDSEFRPNGKPLPRLFSMDACEKVRSHEYIFQIIDADDPYQLHDPAGTSGKSILPAAFFLFLYGVKF